MPRHLRARAALALSLGPALAAFPGALAAQQGGRPPAPASVPGTSIAASTAGLEKRDGVIPLYLDASHGKLLLELPRDSARALFVVTQATGLGSNPIGIDRGAGGDSRVLRFDRDGERVLAVFENWDFRSSAATDAAHQRSVREAFPPSTVAALPLVAQENGRLLVDATDFVMRDWNDVEGTLARSRQGTYTVARDRWSIYRPYTRAFPENTEIDVALTFATSGPPGRNSIIYYVDRGIPEPIRTATLEGVRWWAQAFDRAGLEGGFRVELLPEGVDPMDARYNVVQWENRNERGWSVGGSVTDPRGEILKRMARLDSHRARTDYNLYAGLVGADASAADTAFVLARVRQVSAHEVGHTLGLSHNYIASTYDRGSVMDYPPPRVLLGAGGRIDLSQAYAAGPGPYDVWAIRWGYGIFPAASEADSLRAIVREGLRQGFRYLSDADARPEFGSDPRTNLWDDVQATEFLRREMDVRRVALGAFGERDIRPGQPLVLLQERFAPVYFMHRFAINAASKTIAPTRSSNGHSACCSTRSPPGRSRSRIRC